MMTTSNTDAIAPRNPIRLWPGLVAVVLQWISMLAVPAVVPGTGMFGVLGGLAIGLIVLVWWVFFSRLAWAERIGALIVIVAGLAAASRLAHPSIAHGMMGMLLFIYAVPVLSLTLVAWAAVAGRRPAGIRRLSLVAAITIACALFTVVRTSGVAGDGQADFGWRWTPSAEERLLASTRDAPAPSVPRPEAASVPAEPLASKAPVAGQPVASAPPSAPAPIPVPVMTSPEWPGFRGPNRDGVVRGVRIETDWSRVPPVLMWRRPIGPGWSSFAVHGELLYTQEQRGDDELVACYKVSTGEIVWRHRDAARFWESNAGAGPRATPTLGHGRVYALGATGLLNALDARSGAVVWSRNVAADTGTKVPIWGFAASPILVNNSVVVAASGALAAYDIDTGVPRWTAKDRGGSYSSPQSATIGGIAQVLFLSGTGITSVDPANGAVLWEHAWPGSTIIQPSLTDDGDILLSTGGNTGGLGVRRLAVARGTDGWKVEERWTSTALKPYFNDLAVFRGHAFGFDGSILACIDLADGKRAWKGGRYGYGQLVLLPDQDLLLVLSEDGDLALVGATPDQFREIARVPAINGKTWNHPVLVGDILLVRNGEEMAAFRLTLAGR